MSLTVGCQTTYNNAPDVWANPHLATLKAMGYTAGISAALGGDKDQIREQVDKFAKAQGYTGWKDVCFEVANVVSSTPDFPPAAASEIQVILNMLEFTFPD